MQQRPENFRPAGADPEATLVTPRFDETEARRAHPVVRLEDVPPRGHTDRARVRGARRPLTNALLAVALLAVAAFGGAVVTKFMLNSRTEQTQEQTPNEQTEPTEQTEQTKQTEPARNEQTEPTRNEQTQVAPVQTAKAPPPPTMPQTVEANREETTTARSATRDARARRAPATAALAEPDEVERYEDGRRRGRRAERRREREEEEVEKEMRKASKREKDRSPRLVDVLTPPR